MSSHRYVKPGRYVAICNNINFDGHYTRFFDLPEEGKNGRPQGTDAAWYFLNRLDHVSCIEAVYPLDIFESTARQRTIDGRYLRDGETVQVDHYVSTFLVSIRSMSFLSADRIKGELQKQWEVTDIRQLENIEYVS
jgi:hypothetical protein